MGVLTVADNGEHRCVTPDALCGGNHRCACGVAWTDDKPFVCSLCWFTFATADQLAQHVEMEEAVSWTIDGLEREDA